MPSLDVVIAGAGIIGLSIAFELAAQGLRVAVIERGAAMREASWAAAGMLAAHDPENAPELRALADLSVALYPEFLSRIEQVSGLRIPLRTGGTLQGVQARRDRRTAALSDEALRAYVPGLVPGHRSFYWLDEHSLDPRDLCRALPPAVRAAGVALYEHTAVHGIRRAGNRLQIETSGGGFLTRQYIHCCGAWSAMPGFDLPVEPRKGQMLAVTLPPDAARLAYVIRTPELYLVPRGQAAGETGARIVVGATVERAGFDRAVSERATASLLAAAAELWPPILTGVVTDAWTGLRPGSPDGLPVLDSLDPAIDAAVTSEDKKISSSRTGAWVATGHFRNGILLAPGTARVLRQLVLCQAPEIALQAFRLGRFAPVEAPS